MILRTGFLVTTVLVSACASGGAAAPDMTPAEANLMYARYSGTWTLSEELSDPGSAALETEASPERGDRLGERPETTSRAIRPTYQRAGEARSAVSGRMNRIAMRQVILSAGTRPERLTIALSADGLTMTMDDREPWVLPEGGGWIDVREQLAEGRVRLVWEEDLPIVERDIPGGGVIREVLEVANNGGTLWMTRQVLSGGTEAWNPAQFTFGRSR